MAEKKRERKKKDIKGISGAGLAQFDNIYWLSRSVKKLRINEFSCICKKYTSKKLKKYINTWKRSLLTFKLTTKDHLKASFSDGKDMM